MRVRDRGLYDELRVKLSTYASGAAGGLPGIVAPTSLDALCRQIVESVRRIRFFDAIQSRGLSPERVNSAGKLFDPIRAALIHKNSGNTEEAFWLAFLSVHFGRSSRTGWRLVRDVYGQMGRGSVWDWTTVSADVRIFQDWLSSNQLTLQGKDGIARQFGNHRKYETLDAASRSWTGLVIESYVNWVMTNGGAHKAVLDRASRRAGGDKAQMFDELYSSLNIVLRFGRTARFDYLCMLRKLGLADIEPGIAYLSGSTGPIKGARLLFDGRASAPTTPAVLERSLVPLASYLGLGPLRMQVLEDALCNWQKSPNRFLPFRG